MANIQNSTTIPHIFNSHLIFQMESDTILAGKLVPKGYCNVTQLCKAGGKLWGGFYRLNGTKEYIEALALDMQICTSSIIIELKGTPNGDPALQGTWVHYEIALDVARWVSTPMRIWANRTLRAVIEGDFKPLTEEAAIIQSNLRETWQGLRNASKAAFWSLGDAVKSYIQSNPSKSDKYKQFAYSLCQDCINKALFGKAAKAIREDLGVTDLLRDHYGTMALRRLDLIQSLASAMVINQNMEPLEATKYAVKLYNFDVIDYKA